VITKLKRILFCRYQDILRAFHLVDNSAVPRGNTDRFVKLGMLMTSLCENFRLAVNPQEFLCVDESLLPFKGRLSFKQFNPMKRSRFGIKLIVLCDAENKYVLDILPYQGKSTAIQNNSWIEKFGFGGASVLTLLQRYLGKNHRVTIDNWFMSPTLAKTLYDKQTFVLGTAQKRRKLMPKMPTKLAKGDVETYCNGEILLER